MTHVGEFNETRDLAMRAINVKDARDRCEYTCVFKRLSHNFIETSNSILAILVAKHRIANIK